MEMIIMSMRSQVYEWNGLAGSSTANWTSTNAGNSTSIFIGGFGNNITKPAETTATEFVVIEDISCTPSQFATASSTSVTLTGAGAYRGQLAGFTPAKGVLGPRAYVQVRINTTDYFLDPDNVANDGIPGTASPYPRSLDFQPSFNLYPDVYVLPGQVWDVLYTAYNAGSWGASANGGDQYAFTKYTLYDGPDALIANKLLEMGISINPGNVDWYKRSLLSAQGM
jgi:hypothetical protein